MTEDIKIKNPVEIKDNSKERVAWELTQDIASKENLYKNSEEYRKKILDLYAECLDATNWRRDYDGKTSPSIRSIPM